MYFLNETCDCNCERNSNCEENCDCQGELNCERNWDCDRNSDYDRDSDRERDSNCHWDCDRDRDYDSQRHVHEITGSTEIVNECGECHNHRFCTVSGEARRWGDSHVHEIRFRTDFADGHYHEFRGISSPAIRVGNGKHIHFATSFTEEEDGHVHRFQAASLINSPIDFSCDE